MGSVAPDECWPARAPLAQLKRSTTCCVLRVLINERRTCPRGSSRVCNNKNRPNDELGQLREHKCQFLSEAQDYYGGPSQARGGLLKRSDELAPTGMVQGDSEKNQNVPHQQQRTSKQTTDVRLSSGLTALMRTVSLPPVPIETKPTTAILRFNLQVDGSRLTDTKEKPDGKPLTERVSQSSSESREVGDRDVDGGYAWVVLAVIFVINASTFGTARAYGLIFDKLAREEGKTRTEAAMPFTLMGAIENMAGPLSGYLLAHTKSSWQVTVFSGSCLVALAHVLAAALVDSQMGQLLAMGLACGLGLSLVSISFFQLNNAYFVRYRSTAFGLGMTGAAIGTLYISPLCQYSLDHYGTSVCYLMLGFILLPNVPLALLLRPKGEVGLQGDESPKDCIGIAGTISGRVEDAQRRELATGRLASICSSIKQVICNPMFHLIWPTQLLFCWLNFVFGMIIVDFGRDRGLSAQSVTHLVPCWAFGQLVGRLCLSSLVDLKFLTYKCFTVICFFSIGATTFLLNQVRPPEEDVTASKDLGAIHLIILGLIFNLSMFIALLYILFNGLVVTYVESSLQPLSIGISSFTGSFFLLPRANIIGYYRDITGNYDAMLTMFTYVSFGAALVWLLVPKFSDYSKRLCLCPVAKECFWPWRQRKLRHLHDVHIYSQ